MKQTGRALLAIGGLLLILGASWIGGPDLVKPLRDSEGNVVKHDGNEVWGCDRWHLMGGKYGAEVSGAFGIACFVAGAVILTMNKHNRKAEPTGACDGGTRRA